VTRKIFEVERQMATLIAMVILVDAVVLVLGPLQPSRGADSPPAVTAVRAPQQTFASCLPCHEDIDRGLAKRTSGDVMFLHKRHFARASADCAVCHPSNAHEPDGTNRPTMGRCLTCHGTSAATAAPRACGTCHPPAFLAKVLNESIVSSRSVSFPGRA